MTNEERYKECYEAGKEAGAARKANSDTGHASMRYLNATMGIWNDADYNEVNFKCDCEFHAGFITGAGWVHADTP